MLRLVKGQAHAHHILAGGVQPLLIAAQEGLLAHLDINFLVALNVLPVPGANLGVHGDAAAHHVDALIGEHFAYPKYAPGALEPVLVGVARVLAENRPQIVSVQQDHVGLGGLQPLVEQPADGGLARPGQSGEKIHSSLFHTSLLSGAAVGNFWYKAAIQIQNMWCLR